MSLPVEILFGIYLGVLTGVVPALIAGVLGFIFKYVTGVTIPGFGVVALALGVAGVNGGLLALNDQTIRTAERAPAILTAILIVLMISLYAHARGDELGASAPKRVSLRTLRDRTLSADVIELVGDRGQVRVHVAGEIRDMEGYPPLPAATRRAIADGEWRFPADIPLEELEARFTERLRAAFDLADVDVRLDENARATVTAAPPTGALSTRVPAGKRAVSVSALVPTGLARGDVVSVCTPDATIAATVLGVPVADGHAASVVESGGDDLGERPDVALGPNRDTTDTRRTDGGASHAPTASTPTARGAAGGMGRVTVAVEHASVGRLLQATQSWIVVHSRGTRPEFALTSLLRRAGRRFKRLRVVAAGPLDGGSVDARDLRETYDVAVVAARCDGRWTIVPDELTSLVAGDELFVVGTRESLAGFNEVAA